MTDMELWEIPTLGPDGVRNAAYTLHAVNSANSEYETTLWESDYREQIDTHVKSILKICDEWTEKKKTADPEKDHQELAPHLWPGDAKE